MSGKRNAEDIEGLENSDESEAKKAKKERICKLVLQQTTAPGSDQRLPLEVILSPNLPIVVGRSNPQLVALVGKDHHVSREAATFVMHPTEDFAFITVVSTFTLNSNTTSQALE